MATTRFEDWVERARAAGVDGLRSAVTVPVLVEVAPLVSARQGVRGYFTSVDDRACPVCKSADELLKGPIHAALLVAKSSAGAFSTQVGIGRSRSVDIVLPYRHISKLHAVLCRAEGDAGGYALMDAGSTNGTWLGDHRLSPREQRAVVDGAVLRLGSSQLVYLSAAAFVELVRARAAA